MEITVELDFGGDVRTLTAQSCSWGLTHPGSGGSPQGDAAAQDFTLTTTSSPQTTQLLALACESGATLTQVTVTVVDPGQGGGARWRLANAFVSSFQTGVDASAASAVDSFSISFQSFSVEVV